MYCIERWSIVYASISVTARVGGGAVGMEKRPVLEQLLGLKQLV
jgi:hypothetical protein